MDINGDGLIDYFDGSSFRLGTGKGMLSYNAYSGVPAISDITSQSFGMNVNLGVGVGSGLCLSVAIFSANAAVGVTYGSSSSVVNQKLMDINGDGLQDIVSMERGSTTIKVKYNNGNSFTDYQIVDIPSWGYTITNNKDAFWDMREGFDFDTRLYAETDNDALFAKIFTCDEKQKQEFLSTSDRVNFLRWIWELAIDNALNDELGVDLFKYFDYNDFYKAWRVNNWKEYYVMGPSKEFSDIVRRGAAVDLKHIIEHADKALAGGEYRATLRYGHDSQLTPLAVVMDIEGACSPVVDPDHPEASWILDNICPMGANIQLVFFRKKRSDDILVKVLLNERESRIVGIETDQWPFYHWSDLRAHYISVIDALTAE